MTAVVLTQDASDDFDHLPRPIRGRPLKIFERLADWPNVSGAKPLRKELVGKYRMRTGDYRLRFRVEGEKVIVEKIGDRDQFYEG